MSDLAKWVEKVNTGKFPRINESVVMKNPENGIGETERPLSDPSAPGWSSTGKFRKAQVAMSANALEMR